MELMHGSPKDMAGRSEREVRAYALLDRLGVEFDRTDHPETPATSMEVCGEVDAVLGVHICKNLFLCNRQKTSFYLLVMPGDKPFRTKAAHRPAQRRQRRSGIRPRRQAHRQAS